MLDEKSLQKLRALRNDFELFAKSNLKVKTKDSKLVKFEFNAAQRYVDTRLNEQMQSIGRVRALVLKGRQQGISTYVSGRFYHKSSLRKYRNVYIMSHEQTASDSLFGIVDRFHTQNPMRPHTAVANVKELEFDRLDSSYAVGTAGQKAGGRGKTVTLYHGSEVAFWTNAALHFASSVQAVPDMPGTEIILESTANGPQGEFYERWQDAMAGRSDYIAIFIPWFWSPEYRRDDLVTPDFELNGEAAEGDLSEREYAELHGLDLAQMAWRRNKIAELRSEALFKQEYPATPDEAFQASGVDSLLTAAIVLRARKRKDIEGAGPLIMGVDPAGPGGDRFAISVRRGNEVLWTRHRDKLETRDACEWLNTLIEEHRPARCFVDAGGIGYPVISLMRTDYAKNAACIRAVNFGSPSEHKRAKPKVPGPKNRRAEMYQRLRDAMVSEEGFKIPDRDDIQADLTGVQIKQGAALNNDLLLVSKEEMRKKGVRSPDLGDSIALTFASLHHIKDADVANDRRNAAAQDPGSARWQHGVNLGSDSNHGWMG